MSSQASWLQQARAYFDRGMIEDCIGAIRKGQAAEPQNHHYLTLLARCYVKQKKSRDAMKTATQAMQMAPNSAECHIVMALAQWSSQKIDEALKTVDLGLQKHPNQSSLFEIRSRLYAAKSRWKDSLAAAESGLVLRPNSSVLAELRGQALSRLGRTEEAGQVLAGAIADNPDQSSTLAQMGWNELRMGQFQKAARLFQDALRNDPNSSNARLGLLECLRAAVPPYRIVAKVNDRLRGMGRGFAVAPWLIYYLLRSGATAAGESGNGLPPAVGLTLSGLVAVVALIRPVSQGFVLFHPIGHDALYPAERAIAGWFLIWFAISLVSLPLLLAIHNDKLLGMLWPSFLGLFIFTMLSYLRDTSKNMLVLTHVLGGICSVLAVGALVVGVLPR